MPSTTETFCEAPPGLPNLKVGKGATKAPGPRGSIDVIDIRRAAVELNLKEEIHSLFRPREGPRTLPTLLLYDEKGLQLFEQITYLEEYYLTNYEIQVLRRSARAIAKAIPSGSMIVELGSGNLRKVQLLLQALEDAGKSIDYYALDLSKQELERTLAQIPPFRFVRCHGLLGTYDDGREWLKRPSVATRPKCILSMGSSIGNFSHGEDALFLKGFADVLQPSDTFLLGLDSCANPTKVYHAYNDREGVTHDGERRANVCAYRFILNGLRNANKVLGSEVFKPDEWRVIGEYVYDGEGGRHQAFYSPIHDTVVLGDTIKTHERIQVEQSLKYSMDSAQKLYTAAGMVEIDRWMTDGDEYGLHLLAKNTTMPFDLHPTKYAPFPIPSLQEWENLWSTWDTVTRQMLPHGELLDKPIKLRNACIFYLGHIPTFLDIQLTKTTKTPPTEPAFYYSIFERGIDPDVDNPEMCHAHSEIPDEWPALEDILQHQKRVRARLGSLYSSGQSAIPREVGMAIWIGFEHEIMHLETLLYMMLQSDKTLPPPHAPRPDFEALAQKTLGERTTNDWFDIPEQPVDIGMDDREDDVNSHGHFGWDNEKPLRRVNVRSFQAKGRPITNEEYAEYLYQTKNPKIPASWAVDEQVKSNGTSGANGASNGHTNGHANGSSSVPASFLEGKSVRTVYGLVPIKFALDWPVFASYDELAGCATWMGGRIPTFEEARSIYAYVDHLKKDQAERKLGRTVPAVNGHLVNDGVEETPPSSVEASKVNGDAAKPSELFIDLQGANVGFQHWHPTAVTAHGNRLAGQAEMGGVWEWTSSPLTMHEGFEPMSLYPLYTADFFDGKHNIVLGGSWATHSRIAGRKSFVNWYQRNYPYPWVGARLVRDL
ncbi:C-type lectin protein [Xylariales sp. PMI_506]|nr:C-type lectin protein [Xylariales sp. PMI_506]